VLLLGFNAGALEVLRRLLLAVGQAIPMNALVRRQVVSIVVQVTAPFALGFLFFHDERGFEHYGVRSNANDLPRDFRVRRAPGYFENVFAYLFSYVQAWHGCADRRERISKVSIERLKPV